MKRNYSLLLIVVALAMLPIMKVIADSATCSGSGPFSCTLSDAFNFLSNPVVPLLGAVVPPLHDAFHLTGRLSGILLGNSLPFTDSFHFFDVSPSIVVSTLNGNPCGNPFNTLTSCNPQVGTGPLAFFDTSSPLGKAVTQVGIPVGLLMGSVFIPAKWGVKSFYIIFPIVNFVILGMAWIGILPPWFVIVDIIIVSAGIAYIVLMLFSGGTKNSQG